MIDSHPALVGHDDALREVREAFASGRMHHAWMITGIEGIGKATLAKQIARDVLGGGYRHAENPDYLRTAKMVDAESHPDMLIIRRPMDEKTGKQKITLPVDEARKAAEFLHKTATHGVWRVVIIDEAHTMNANAQNAILKIVEEPPAHTLILITVTVPGALLPTIRSRCRLLKLSPLSPDDMRHILEITAPNAPPEDLAAIITLARGSVGFAEQMLQVNILPLYREMTAILAAMPAMNVPAVHKLADQIARKGDSDAFTLLSALLVDHLRDVTVTQAIGNGAARQALRLWQQVGDIVSAVDDANLDRKLAFINAMTAIKSLSG